MVDWMQLEGKRFTYYVNDNRVHGFKLPFSSVRGYLVISADFEISEEEVQNLVDNDVVILSTDHHEVQDSFIHIEGETAEGIVLNNQYPFEPEDNRYLSGAGVFYETLCEIRPDFKSTERKALVGITLLSDVREIENKKAHNYLSATFMQHPENSYIGYLVKSTCTFDGGFGVPRMDRNFVDYSFSPCVNSLLRANKTSEAIKFILGGGLEDSETHDLQKSLTAAMIVRAQVLELPNLAVLAINTSDFFDFAVDVTGYVGLLCSTFKDRNKGISTFGFVVDNGKVARASFRGKYSDVPYRTGFLNLGINAQGHPASFGVLDFVPTDEIWMDLSDLITDLETDHKSTETILEVGNLAAFLTSKGAAVAQNNCYVRDIYRTYIKYIGNNVKIVRQTYKMTEFTSIDYATGAKADLVKGGISYKYELDADGNKIVKYIEYLVDGRTVKSFGVSISDGLILPMFERGYIVLYVRSAIS